MEKVTVTRSEIPEEKPKKEEKKFKFIGCNRCHKTNVTLIKATDSYYCRPCFLMLGKKKFEKKKKGDK